MRIFERLADLKALVGEELTTSGTLWRSVVAPSAGGAEPVEVARVEQPHERAEVGAGGGRAGQDTAARGHREQQEGAEAGKLEPQSLNDTNDMELRVHANDARAHAVLTAKLDNLGKGAAGQAIQNVNRAFGFGETDGLRLSGVLV